MRAIPRGLPPGFVATPLDTLRFLRDPEGRLAWTAARCGDTFTIHAESLGTIVHTGDPEGIREIFTAAPDTFEPFLGEVAAPFLGDHSILLKAGPRHRVERRLLTPPFHGARMRLYGDTMREVALGHAARWRPGRRLSVLETTQAITLEVITRAIFGVGAPDRREEVCRVVRDYVGSWHPLIVFFPGLRRSLFGRGPWARFQRAHARISDLLLAEIDRRRAGAAPGEDVLSLLLGARYDDGEPLSREEVRDQLLTLLFAGHDTTSASLAWALYHLAEDGAARDRVLAELAALGPEPPTEALSDLPFLDAVCQETLRLHPVVAHIPRRLLRPLRLRGYDLPAGMGVSANVIVAHRREDVYPQARAWRPERFLGRSYTPFEFLPFGGGSRRCVGAAFALYEMKIVLAALLPRYPLRLRGRGLPRLVYRNFTLGPDPGAGLELEERRAA